LFEPAAAIPPRGSHVVYKTRLFGSLLTRDAIEHKKNDASLETKFYVQVLFTEECVNLITFIFSGHFGGTRSKIARHTSWHRKFHYFRRGSRTINRPDSL
jgi:hypothetical protein